MVLLPSLRHYSSGMNEWAMPTNASFCSAGSSIKKPTSKPASLSCVVVCVCAPRVCACTRFENYKWPELFQLIRHKNYATEKKSLKERKNGDVLQMSSFRNYDVCRCVGMSTTT